MTTSLLTLQQVGKLARLMHQPCSSIFVVELDLNLKHFMKPNGRAAILEHRKRAGILRRVFGHYVEKKQKVEEMRAAEYQLQEEFDYLPEQSFTIYVVNTE
ncbi:MAG: hypothetical protein KGY80_13335 [Candidatus Thorarchaeota archaeon]|nr:hypothetical protein [Candidatus Thorarchaeota archaeon]